MFIDFGCTKLLDKLNWYMFNMLQLKEQTEPYNILEKYLGIVFLILYL